MDSATLNNIKKDFNIKIEDFKYKNLKYDKEKIKLILNISTLSSDFNFFKKIFLEGKTIDQYPIIYNKRVFYYWLNNQWNEDTNCEYIINVILKTIKCFYYSVNTFENYQENMGKFLENQKHIKKLDDKRYISSFISKLKKCINKK
jgi:hypothetical protein